MNAAPSPEVLPSLDETRPTIGPNLAGAPPLCKAVLGHVYRDFFYPYMLQQQRMHATWQRIDDAWRVKGKRDRIDISYLDPASKVTSPDGKGQGLTSLDDGISSKVYPAAMHRQIRNKTDMHMSIAWADGIPVRAKLPDTLYEHPLYNPNAQSVEVANELLHQCADAVEMKRRDRKIRGSWAKYGHAWAHVDFRYRFRDQPMVHRLPPDPRMAGPMLQALAMQYGGPPQFGQDQFGPTATWMQRVVDPDSMVTDFVPLRHDAVFVDQTLSADEMDRQPCPLVRSHVTRFDLFGNDYEPQLNPFGWLNVQQALSKGKGHYTLSAQDEQNFRQELLAKTGVSDTAVLRPKDSIKQLWTCYPMLAIDPMTGLLDEGDGIVCPTCQGAKQVVVASMQGGSEPAQYSTMPDVMAPVIIGAGGPVQPVMQAKQTCPDCQGEGRKFITPQRYVVQMFGLLSMGGDSAATVLRIQLNPTVKNKVPLLFGAHLTEDTAGAIPLSVSEASLSSADQLATAHNQVLDAKNMGINRKWIVQREEPCAKEDLNRIGKNIEVDMMNNAMPAPTIAYDITANLTREYIPMQEDEVQNIGGIPPTLLGMVSNGRRAATEIQTASDAAKLPITVEIDSCNTQIHGRWAQFHLWNLEAYADRDWMQRRTGRTSFGRVKLHTQVAEDFFTKQAQMQLLQNFLPVAPTIQGANAARMAQEIFKLAGFDNASEFVDDGGTRKAVMDAFRIIADILGEGKLEPPNPWDPHEIYIQCFQQALMDKDWKEKAPEMLPLLEQRMQYQDMLLRQQQQQQFMMQLQQTQMMALAGGQQQGPGGANNPKKNGPIPSNPTQARQAQAGRNQPQ